MVRKAERAEMLAKLRLKKARIEAEQNLIACSGKGSTVSALLKSHVSSRRGSGDSIIRVIKALPGVNAGSNKLQQTSNGAASK